MNKHLNDGQLRAALDGELNAAEAGHLQNCPACQTRESALRAQVRDFIKFIYWLPWTGKKVWPLFNLADAFICVGVFLLTVEMMFSTKRS